jgi:hypothetical protein
MAIDLDVKRATRVVDRFANSVPSIGRQMHLLLLAERALVEASKWSSFERPDGELHFDGSAGPLSDGLAFLIGALKAEEAQADSTYSRSNAADRFKAASKLAAK